MKRRLSANQRDTLFVLALFKVKNVTAYVALSKVKAMLEQSRSQELDPANYRKGMHLLAKRGLIEMVREHDLSLSMRLTELGVIDAAKVFQEKTGQELALSSAQTDQITVFEAIENQAKAASSLTAEEHIEREFGDEYSAEQIDEMTEKFKDVVAQFVDDYDMKISQCEFESLLFNALAKEGARAFLNLRCIRHTAREVLGF
ncbi:TPA: hypothetical protein ACX6RA_003574 [Photobacterium damselae]